MMQRLLSIGARCLVTCLALGTFFTSAGEASAQFGGYQQMQLDKIRQRQALDAQRLGRGPGPVAPVVPPQQRITKNFFITPPYYGFPYGYSYGWNDFGYSYYGGWPAAGYYPGVPAGPIIINPAPQIQGIFVQPPAAAGAGAAVMPNEPIAQARPLDAQEEEIRRRVSVLKPSTAGGRTRADNLIADGDREFAEQQYRRAASKYREAIARAPDYAAGHLRAGHAYTATGDYELAVTYFAMGFELARSIDRAGFSLAALYRGNRLAKEQHLEALADATLRQPEEGGLLFLTGLALHYDSKPLQARDYFRRAAEMPGRHRPYAAMFLPQAGG